MEIHTILLAAVAILSGALFAAYLTLSHKATQAHLDLLCKRDQSDPVPDSHQWKRIECYRTVIAVSQLLLLIVWGAFLLFDRTSRFPFLVIFDL